MSNVQQAYLHVPQEETILNMDNPRKALKLQAPNRNVPQEEMLVALDENIQGANLHVPQGIRILNIDHVQILFSN